MSFQPTYRVADTARMRDLLAILFWGAVGGIVGTWWMKGVIQGARGETAIGRLAHRMVGWVRARYR
jgi:hypothetical protein